jgi:hypothetical protein
MESVELRALHDTFVRPFYLKLLGGNMILLDEVEGADFRRRLVNAARDISDKQLETLFIEREWRGRLSAAWLTGLSDRIGLVSTIGELLLRSEVVYAGRGYCVALALIGNEECVSFLRKYLDIFLPLNGRAYDQSWALGALSHLLEGAVPSQYLDPELWRDGKYFMDPARGIENFSSVISSLRTHGMMGRAS